MKRVIKVVAAVLALVALSAIALTGCDLTRKLGGAEATFPGKVSGAKSLSFKMNVQYKKGDAETVVYMDCYKQTADGGAEYAYVYSCPQALYDSYKNIYADGKLYEVINVTKNSGSYHVKDGVAVDDEGNILYHVTQNILLTSVAALLTKAKKETIDGETTYRYDIDINGKTVSIWYNDKVMVRLYAKFEPEKEGDDPEEYTIALSDYKFDQTIAADVFARPSTYGVTYLPSPFSFEDWMSVITTFAAKLG
ncbi:MAG: hypothetical protein K5753_02185 [Clostridia bacterium]|nr:hypothetical protein [Clostridia bacterium]